MGQAAQSRSRHGAHDDEFAIQVRRALDDHVLRITHGAVRPVEIDPDLFGEFRGMGKGVRTRIGVHGMQFEIVAAFNDLLSDRDDVVAQPLVFFIVLVVGSMTTRIFVITTVMIAPPKGRVAITMASAANRSFNRGQLARQGQYSLNRHFV